MLWPSCNCLRNKNTRSKSLKQRRLLQSSDKQCQKQDELLQLTITFIAAWSDHRKLHPRNPPFFEGGLEHVSLHFEGILGHSATNFTFKGVVPNNVSCILVWSPPGILKRGGDVTFCQYLWKPAEQKWNYDDVECPHVQNHRKRLCLNGLAIQLEVFLMLTGNPCCFMLFPYLLKGYLLAPPVPFWISLNYVAFAAASAPCCFQPWSNNIGVS